MAGSHSSNHSIREWLRDIHADLEVYLPVFEELGYNLQFLMETDSKDLEQDLQRVVKRVHLRVILQRHAKLKMLTFSEPAAGQTPPRQTQASSTSVESSVFHLIPSAKGVMTFRLDPRSIRSGFSVLIPIWCLRSIQGKVHSQMTFTSGKHKDASVYELIHDMLSGRQRPEDVQPLHVVVDDRGLHIVRGHRRGLALCALQGIWRDRTVHAPCLLYNAQDSEVSSQFAHKDTLVDGLAMQLHGKCPEAWHMGKPLFRTPQEWCDSTADIPGHGSHKKTDILQEQVNKSNFQNPRRSESVTASMAHALHLGTLHLDPAERQTEPAGSGSDESATKSKDVTASKSVCCLCLAGKCSLKGHHSVGKHCETRNGSFAEHAAQTDGTVVGVEGSCSRMMSGDVLGFSRIPGDNFPDSCKMLHDPKLPMGQHSESPEHQRQQTAPAAVSNAARSPGKPLEARNNPTQPTLLSGHAELKESMVVCVQGSSSVMSGEVLKVSSRGGVAVFYSPRDKTGQSQCQVDWFPLDRLKVPDFSNIKPGTEVSVLEDSASSKSFACTVLQVSDQKERARAPVYVRYNGHASDHTEWVGADRLRSKFLMLHAPVLPSVQHAQSCKHQKWRPLLPATKCQTVEQGLCAIANQSSAGELPVSQMISVPQLRDASDAMCTGCTGTNALPWHELDSEAEAFDQALQATQEALGQAKATKAAQWQPRLEEMLAAVETEALRGVLEKHGWSGQQFTQSPSLEGLLEDLNGVGPSEASDSDSAFDSELSIPPSNDMNDMESSCAAAPNDWEDRLARQPTVLDNLGQLTGLVVFGTFRSGRDSSKCSGEVIVHRGPAELHGYKVKIWCGKNRGPTWNYDRCYVRILDARIWGRHQQSGRPLDVKRMELFGRIVHALEFGVPRQKLFVCVRQKIVNNPNCVAFKPINGTFPAIHVPWNTAAGLPSGHDLHVVEVHDWSGDRPPRGQYLEGLKMGSRQSDMSILEPVQISLNFCDWTRGDPRSELAVTDFRQPARRMFQNNGLTVGIQHPGLPIGMVMSCGPSEFYVHVLDVNAYLNILGMDKLENLLRQRSVGVWFLDHFDKPLDANLPLFPPNIEDELTFKAGVERPAVTFTIQATHGKLNVSLVREMTVRCHYILSPQEAGSLILSEGGGAVGQMLRHLSGLVVQSPRGDIARGSGSTWTHLLVALAIPGPLLAAEQLVHGCMFVVDRFVGAILGTPAWNQLLKDPDPQLTVRYVHGRADPSTKKVFAGLLRLDQSEQHKEIQIADAMRALEEILQQPGLTNAQRHACRASFLRRLHAALPAPYYEVVRMCSENSRDQGDWWHPEPRFHVTSPLNRYIDILGMRAFKCQLGCRVSYPHLLLSQRDLDEAIARTNCRMAAESFGLHIFRTISKMRELSGSGQQVLDAVIGGVSPKYIHILVPSETTHTLDLPVPVSSLCSSTCVSEYDAATHSLKLTMQNGRDHVDTLRIHSWSTQPMTCVISRNYSQPIPHHASSNSIVVWEIRFHGEKDFAFLTGLKTFPESFSSWPDLADWHLLDRKVETYSKVWSRIKMCQVHAAAVSSDAYTPATAANDLKWFRTGDAWHFECHIDVKLSEYRWVCEGDLAVLSLDRGGRCARLQGTLLQIKAAKTWEDWDQKGGLQSFIVEVELSKIAELAWQRQDFSLDDLDATSTWSLHFIMIHPNEKKSIQLLEDMQRSPLRGMRLTIPRSSKEVKREMEMRPLVSIEEVKSAMHFACSNDMNERQELAVQRGLQRPFSMVQGPPGTGKTSFLVQCVAALVSASRQRKRGEGRILVCAPSNNAADHILDRLLSAGTPPHYVTRVYSRFIERYHGSMYKGGTTNCERSFWIQPHLEEHALHWKVSESPKVKSFSSQSQEAFDRCYEEVEVQVLRNSRIVVSTCTTAYLHNALVNGNPPHVLRPVSFDSIVIDEAAQASEPDIVLPATSASCRVIVVGDHKQLGPVVTENNLCAPYVSALETPFLERIYQNPRRSSASTILNMQYRMHPSIRSFPSSQFYESMLEDQVSFTHRPKLNCIWPQKKDHRRFIDCQTPQSMGVSPETRACDAALMESKVSLKNEGEARAVVAACAALLRQNCAPRDIAVITPYKAQQHEIRARLERDREIGSTSASILVGTVHALQGSEREYIIVSFVRSIDADQDVVTSVAKTPGDSVALQEMYEESLGILKNFRVLNVAITRAKYGLICVGNSEVLSKGSKDFNAFIHSLRSRKCIVSQKDFLESVRSRRVCK